MYNTIALKELVTDLMFEHDDLEGEFPSDAFTDPHALSKFIDRSEDAPFVAALSEFLSEHYAQKTAVTKEDIKQVFVALRDGEENPRGTFDKQGRFYLRDGDLVDVRAPSAKYPYSQMQAGRTLKFIRNLADKYRCQNLEELEKVAFS